MGKVILIGGSPMIGKSTVAVEIASLLKCQCLSTDDLGEVLQTVISINPMQGADFRAYYANTSVEKLIADIQQYHKTMEPAIHRLIDIHGSWGNSLVIEGWALYPHSILPFQNESIFSCWLIAADGLLESRLESKTDFLAGKAAENYLLRSKWHNALLFDQCKSLKAHYSLIDGTESPSSLAQIFLDFSS